MDIDQRVQRVVGVEGDGDDQGGSFARLWGADADAKAGLGIGFVGEDDEPRIVMIHVRAVLILR